MADAIMDIPVVEKQSTTDELAEATKKRVLQLLINAPLKAENMTAFIDLTAYGTTKIGEETYKLDISDQERRKRMLLLDSFMATSNYHNETGSTKRMSSDAVAAEIRGWQEEDGVMVPKGNFKTELYKDPELADNLYEIVAKEAAAYELLNNRRDEEGFERTVPRPK